MPNVNKDRAGRMFIYWLLFIIPALAVFAPFRLRANQALGAWLLVGTFMAVIIGFRHEVGGDWFNYLPHFQEVSKLSFLGALGYGDPGYYGLNWIVAQLGGEIYLVNFVCACVLMVGTVIFSRTQPLPWLALLVAVPYLLIVVGMGYTRQSVALGFFMIGLVALNEGRVRTFVLWVVLAALFHKSAVVMVPIAAVAGTKNRWLTIAWVGIAVILLYFVLLADSASALVTNYVDSQLQSDGGAIRVTMNAFPAVLLLLFRKRLVGDPAERRLWIIFALVGLACVPLVSYASTAVDRMALYVIPLQMYVFSRLFRIAKTNLVRPWIILGVVAYYAVVEFVWLNYAGHSELWLPYQFVPL
jgi:hypothetical protein